MEKQNLRVIVASEYPEVRYFLRGIVEQEGQTVIVGQAENATRALTLARNLRPDVAVIDCCLPHAVGLDTVALSRISGLDTAQNISEEIPNTRVILLRNLNDGVLPENGLASDDVAFFSRGITGANLPFTLHERYHQALPLGALIFADVVVKPWSTPRQKGDEIAGGAIFLGTAAILGGGFLIGTLILAPLGVLLALAGAVTVSFGLIRKLIAPLWRKEHKTGRTE